MPGVVARGESALDDGALRVVHKKAGVGREPKLVIDEPQSPRAGGFDLHPPQRAAAGEALALPRVLNGNGRGRARAVRVGQELHAVGAERRRWRGLAFGGGSGHAHRRNIRRGDGRGFTQAERRAGNADLGLGGPGRGEQSGQEDKERQYTMREHGYGV